MPDRILTSHAGSLPRPEDLVALNFERIEGRFSDEDALPAQAHAGGRGGRRAPVRDRDRPRQRRRVRPLDGPSLRLRLVVDVRVSAPGWARAGPDPALEIAQARPKPGRARARAVSPSAATGSSSPTPTATPARRCALPTPPEIAPVCRGPITYLGQEAIAARHRQLQGGAGRRRDRGGLPELGGAG